MKAKKMEKVRLKFLLFLLFTFSFLFFFILIFCFLFAAAREGDCYEKLQREQDKRDEENARDDDIGDHPI